MPGLHLCCSCKHRTVKKILRNCVKQPTSSLGIVVMQVERPLFSFGNILDILENDTKICLNLTKKRLNNIDIHPKWFFFKADAWLSWGKKGVVEDSFELSTKSIIDPWNGLHRTSALSFHRSYVKPLVAPWAFYVFFLCCRSKLLLGILTCGEQDPGKGCAVDSRTISPPIQPG